MEERIAVIDFGGQSSQLLTRRIRDLGVFSELLPNTASLEKIKGSALTGIVLTGGPDDVNSETAKKCSEVIFELNVPILGIGYGMHVIAKQFGGEITPMENAEYGQAQASFGVSPLFENAEGNTVWMNHDRAVSKLPDGFVSIAATENCPNAAIADPEKNIYGLQFAPEVTHTEAGQTILKNFVTSVCRCSCSWKADFQIETFVQQVREQVGDGSVVAGLSGGVDSTVSAALVQKAIGDRLTCIFVNHGLLRENEVEEVLDCYKNALGFKVVYVDASKRFLNKLAGVTDPEQKRKIIGEEFIRVFEEEAEKLGGADFLLQGTIYPDVIESGTDQSRVIKSHHNVGGLPKNIRFKGLVEPLRWLFKDEVRVLGEKLGVPSDLVWRQPFPGPGLGVRVIGEITEDKLKILRHTDLILRQEIKAAGLNRSIWQYFTVFTGIRSVGVKGDERTYDYTIAVRAINSTDVMSAQWAEIPYPVLHRISDRILAEVPHVNRVVYDITSKPPSTVEWE